MMSPEGKAVTVTFLTLATFLILAAVACSAVRDVNPAAWSTIVKGVLVGSAALVAVVILVASVALMSSSLASLYTRRQNECVRRELEQFLKDANERVNEGGDVFEYDMPNTQPAGEPETPDS